MGTIGARRAAELVDHLRLLAIEAMVLVQGFELEDGFGGGGFVPASTALAEQVRETVPFLEDDRPLSDDIERLAAAWRR